jgi:O6-methylguanine-DNA--protein-cysteine methyltransferase
MLGFLKNPIPILIPCHRITESSGTITGYRGGIELKTRLVALEGNVVLDIVHSIARSCI